MYNQNLCNNLYTQQQSLINGLNMGYNTNFQPQSQPFLHPQLFHPPMCEPQVQNQTDQDLTEIKQSLTNFIKEGGVKFENLGKVQGILAVSLGQLNSMHTKTSTKIEDLCKIVDELSKGLNQANSKVKELEEQLACAKSCINDVDNKQLSLDKKIEEVEARRCRIGSESSLQRQRINELDTFFKSRFLFTSKSIKEVQEQLEARIDGLVSEVYESVYARIVSSTSSTSSTSSRVLEEKAESRMVTRKRHIIQDDEEDTPDDEPSEDSNTEKKRKLDSEVELTVLPEESDFVKKLNSFLEYKFPLFQFNPHMNSDIMSYTFSFKRGNQPNKWNLQLVYDSVLQEKAQELRRHLGLGNLLRDCEVVIPEQKQLDLKDQRSVPESNRIFCLKLNDLICAAQGSDNLDSKQGYQFVKYLHTDDYCNSKVLNKKGNKFCIVVTLKGVLTLAKLTLHDGLSKPFSTSFSKQELEVFWCVVINKLGPYMVWSFV